MGGGGEMGGRDRRITSMMILHGTASLIYPTIKTTRPYPKQGET